MHGGGGGGGCSECWCKVLGDRGVSLIFHYPKRFTILKKYKECIKRCGLTKILIMIFFFFKSMIYLLYLDSRCFFINALNVKRVLHVFRDSGSKFHVSGPWCLIDLWARSCLGLFKWNSLLWRVGYECMSRLWVNTSWKSGSKLRVCLNIKIDVW